MYTWGRKPRTYWRLLIIDREVGVVGRLGRIRKNVLRYRKLLPEAFVTKIRLYVYLIERIIYWSTFILVPGTAKGSPVKSIKLNCGRRARGSKAGDFRESNTLIRITFDRLYLRLRSLIPGKSLSLSWPNFEQTTINSTTFSATANVTGAWGNAPAFGDTVYPPCACKRAHAQINISGECILALRANGGRGDGEEGTCPIC